jgi:dephospho-CoA kinase
VVTIGITGGLGAGKSIACRRLEEQGAIVFDADKVAKDIIVSEPEVREKLINEFGMDIIRDDVINTARLAAIAFSNEENQTGLNNIIHPHVIEQFEKLRESKKDWDGLLVMDAPLIFESGLDGHFDHTVLIYSKMKLRIGRAMRRGNLSREQILRRMELQMPEEDKRDLASIVIDNNGTVEQLLKEIDRLYQDIMGE